MPPNGSCVDVCSSVLLFSAILGCQRTEPPLKPLSEFAEPALNYHERNSKYPPNHKRSPDLLGNPRVAKSQWHRKNCGQYEQIKHRRALQFFRLVQSQKDNGENDSHQCQDSIQVKFHTPPPSNWRTNRLARNALTGHHLESRG